MIYIINIFVLAIFGFIFLKITRMYLDAKELRGLARGAGNININQKIEDTSDSNSGDAEGRS